MNYSKDEVKQYIEEEDVKFIRLAFCDVFGNQKNVSIMPDELDRAFEKGISFDISAFDGFNRGMIFSDTFLHPDPSTITVLPWRPEQGRVVHMFCDITYPGGKPFEADTRYILQQAVKEAEELGLHFHFGSEMEFYLFLCDESGRATSEPYDTAGYMGIAPEDKGENVRREICLTLEQMGIKPEGSHHEAGPGQNEIDFKYSSPVPAADNAVTFKAVVNTIAARNGLYASFQPKPIIDRPGSGMHINFSVRSKEGGDLLPYAIAGVLKYISEMTVFLNPSDNSYKRLGGNKAPQYISWSAENRSQLIRIPAAEGEYRRAEIRSPDPLANPYLAYTLIIYAAIDGIKNKIDLQTPADINFFTASSELLSKYQRLPDKLPVAAKVARESEFIRSKLPNSIIKAYCGY